MPEPSLPKRRTIHQTMRPSRSTRWLIFVPFLYLALCTIGGIFVADGTLHPTRRPLNAEEIAAVRQTARALDAELSDASIVTPDNVTLRAWIVRPAHSIGNGVILLHGMGDNRLGMTSYAQFLLSRGFTVLLPDSRAHGLSGGTLATYGLLERNDIHQWFDFLAARDHPRCIFALGECRAAPAIARYSSKLLRRRRRIVLLQFSRDRLRPHGTALPSGPLVRPHHSPAIDRGRFPARPPDPSLEMNQISPEDSVAATNVPVLLIHGQLDSNIPIRHSRQIRARNPNTQLWEVPGAEHCGAAGTAPEEFDRRLLDWFVPREARTLPSGTVP